VTQVNLHSHSEFSTLDGYVGVHDIAKRVKECGHEYMALTDHGECAGHLAGAKAAAAQGLGFIPGMEGYWMYPADLARHRAEKKQPKPSHICLLAADDQGLSNLWALSSRCFDPENFYYKPIASPELLREYSEGLYASDGCMLTEFADKVDAGDEDGARMILGTLRDIFRERFYIELHTWQYLDDSKPERLALNARMRRLNHAKVRLATEMGVPLVVVNDSHHAYPEQWINNDLVWAFNTSGDNNDKLQTALGEMAPKADHIMAEDEIHQWMGRHGVSRETIAEAITNAAEIAARCKVDIKPTLSMPRTAATDLDELGLLIDACEAGFKKFVVDAGLDTEVYGARLEEELRLITARNFAGYFNMVHDCAKAYRSGAWAQYVKKGAAKEPILLGPGRGSVGGSLVAYLLSIHLIDPIEYGTLFSRFISPGRKGLPDIDIDVPQSQRKDALEYLPARYGTENVCVIGTVIRNGPKATVKDMGRALGITKLPGGYTDLQTISDHIKEVEGLKDPLNPDEEELTWAELIERKGGALAPYRAKYPQLFDGIEQMVGVARNYGVHASAVLISGTPLRGRMPMRRTKEDKSSTSRVITTQFDMWEVEELGGVKQDWLGLRNLDTLTVARELIYERHQVWIDYDRTGLSIPPGCTKVITLGKEHFREPEIWEQIDKGYTAGIFQVSTPNCTAAAVEFKPRSEIDIADLTSIIRPGVADVGLKEVYLRRRAGVEPVVYDHPMMESIVGPGWATNTYGVLVYQEQIIACVQELAGFTPDEADDLRKAVGKKLMDKLVPFKEKFVSGCYSDWEIDRRIAHKIWASIEAAGRYAFNWSHAVEYAYIATWGVWVKHHYPAEFLVALLATDAAKIPLYIREAKRRGLPILPPDINLSGRKFTITDHDIRYGIDSVRGVGKAAADDILRGRPYASLTDYLQRAGEGTDKGVVTNLIYIGAFDGFGTRQQMLQELERFRAAEGLAQSTLDNPEKLAATIERRLADNPAKYRIEVPDFADREVMYGIEKHLLGVAVTVDPMEPYLPMLANRVLDDPLDVLTKPKGEQFYIGGQVAAIKPTVTKKGKNPGQQMAHLTVTWNDAEFRIVCFPEAWRANKVLLEVGVPVVCGVRKLENGCCLEIVERLDLILESLA
jgi:DNA polymerase-3 subunit alpha